MDSKREVLVGIIFLIALVLLGIFTIVVSDYNPFRTEYTWRVKFDNVSGLRTGNQVRASGVEVGRVTRLSLVNGDVIVTLRLIEDLPLYEDGAISIESVSPLGGRYVGVNPGSPDKPQIDTTKILQGEPAPPDITTALGKLLKDIREGEGTVGRLLQDDTLYRNLVDISDSVGKVTADIRDGKGLLGKLASEDSADAYADLESVIASIKEITSQIKSEEGTLGKIIYDDALYAHLDSAAKSISNVVAEIEGGRGTLGRLVADEQLYENIAAVSRALNEGDGLLAQLLNDGELAQDAKSVFQNIGAISQSVRDGKGTLGMLVTDEQLYEETVAVVASLRSAAESLSKPDGTIGKLIHEDALYVKIERLVTELTAAAEDFRESAPVTVFTSAILAGFR